jgi:cytoskeletal protein CcmA (bactofilin family)
MKDKKEVNTGIAHNALATGTFIKGNLKAEEDLRIDGKVEGTIDCAGKIVIGQQAEIVGDIQCINIDIFGSVQGNLTIQETLSIKKSGVFVGELTAGNLEIEAGAVFNGSCKMQ